jgi:hypothetical protein
MVAADIQSQSGTLPAGKSILRKNSARTAKLLAPGRVRLSSSLNRHYLGLNDFIGLS